VTVLDRRGREARYFFRPWNTHNPHFSKNRFNPLYSLEERFAFVRETIEESVQGCQASVQHLNFLDTSPGLHVQDGGYLVGFGFDTLLGNQVTLELSGGYRRCIFFQIKPDLILSEAIELAQVLQHGRCTEDFTSMLSTYTSMVFPISSLKTLLTIRWKVALAFFSPKGITS